MWLAGSVTLAVLSTNVAWYLIRGRLTDRKGAWAAALGPSTWLLTALFFLLPPFAALRAGALSPYFMGLTELDWLAHLGQGGSLIVLCGGLALFGWLIYRRRLREDLSGFPGSTRLVRGWLAPVEAGLHQWHWAFYRAAAITLLAQGAAGEAPGFLRALLASPLYWGSWLGLAVAGLEAALDPAVRAGLRSPGRRERIVLVATLMLVTTALFVLTHNFWLCLGCHALVGAAIAIWFPEPFKTAEDE